MTGIVNSFYQEMVSLEYIMANPNISESEMITRLDRAIKEIKRKYNKMLFGDGKNGSNRSNSKPL